MLAVTASLVGSTLNVDLGGDGDTANLSVNLTDIEVRDQLDNLILSMPASSVTDFDIDGTGSDTQAVNLIDGFMLSGTNDIRSVSQVNISGTQTAGAVFVSAAAINVDGIIDTGVGTVTIETDDLTIDPLSGGIDAGAGIAVVRNFTTGYEIDLGTKMIGKLGLTDVELDLITAGTLRIGSSDSGPILISDFINPAGTDTLHLVSGAGIGVASFKSVTVTNLAVEAGGLVNLSNNGVNHVETVAIDTTGVVFFVNSAGFTVGEVDGVAGVAGTGLLRASSGDVLIGNTSAAADIDGTFQITLDGDDARLSLASGAHIAATNNTSYVADKMDIQGTISSPFSVLLKPRHAGKAINIGATGDTTPDTLELSDSELDNISASVLRIGDGGSGSINISSLISPAGTDTLHLTSGGTVTQSGAISIKNLAVGASGNITLDTQANEVDTLSMVSSAGGVQYRDVTGFTTGTVDSLHGIQAGVSIGLTSNSGDMIVGETPAARDLDGPLGINITLVGNEAQLTISSGANLQTGVGGNVNIVADKLDLDGTITAVGQLVALRPSWLGGNDAIDLGSTGDSAADTLELSSAEIDRVTADRLWIGSSSAGSITVSGPISPTGTNTLQLTSGAQGATIGDTNAVLTDVTVANLILDGNVSPRQLFDHLTVAGDVAFADGASLATSAFDRIDVTGEVTIGNDVTLAIDTAALMSAVITAGDEYLLIANDGTDAVTGTFASLPEGAQVITDINGFSFQISYAGGSGNDVVLMAVPTTLHWQGDVDTNWSTPGNWLENQAPQDSNHLVFDTNTRTGK